MSMEEHERRMDKRIDQLRNEMQQAGAEQQEQMRAEYERRQAQIQAEMAQLQALYDQLKADEDARRNHAEELRNYPIPEWMNAHTNGVNIGIVGSSGVGKSLLNNRLRGLKKMSDDPSLWAKTGETETTLIPQPFQVPQHPSAHLWDLPGVGTQRFPQETYFRDVGLKHFQTLLVVCRSRFSEGELALRDECQRLGLPVFFVRTFMDDAVENEAEDNELSTAETMRKIRAYLRDHCGILDPYLLALRRRHPEFEAEMERLVVAVNTAIGRFCAASAAARGA